MINLIKNYFIFLLSSLNISLKHIINLFNLIMMKILTYSVFIGEDSFNVIATLILCVVSLLLLILGTLTSSFDSDNF